MLPACKVLLVGSVLIGTGFGAQLLTRQGSLEISKQGRLVPRTSRNMARAPVRQNFDLVKEVGKEHRIVPGVRQVYRVDLKAGQLLRVRIRQAGVDVRLDLFGAEPTSILTIDSPNSTRGPEPLLFVADRVGSYRIEVSTDSQPAPNGRYIVEIGERKYASNHDRRSASALRIYYRARALARGRGPAEVRDIRMKSLVAIQKTGDRFWEAETWLDMCTFHYLRADYQGSIDACRHAANLFHQLAMKDREARAFNQMAFSEQELLEVDAALKHFDQARALAHASGDVYAEAAALINLGLHYADRASAWQAKPYLDRALTLSRQADDQDFEAKAQMGFGLISLRTGQYEKAFRIFRDLLAGPGLTPGVRAVVLRQMGTAFIYAGNPKGAFRFLKEAYDIQKQGVDPDEETRTLIALGLAYSENRDFLGAVDSYQKALAVLRARNRLSDQAVVFLNTGWALSSLKRYDEAKNSFGRALSLTRSAKNHFVEGGALTGLAWMERQRGSLSEAQRWGEEALARIELLRGETNDPDARETFFAKKQETYELLIGVLMDQYEMRGDRTLLKKALETSERARARLLLDVLGERVPSDVLSLEEIQREVLDKDTVLLEYALGRTKSYVWLVTREGIEAFVLPEKEVLEKLARDVNSDLAKSHLPERQYSIDERLCNLGRILLGPVAGRLGNKRLLVVTSGALQLVPFSILPEPGVPLSHRTPWEQPLLLRHEIAQEPSASVFAALQKTHRRRRPAPRALASIADAVFNQDDERIDRRYRKADSIHSDPDYLKPLKASGEEAKAIARLLPASEVLQAFGFEATRDLVIGGKLSEYRVAHISTHGRFLERRPDLAAMILSRYDRRGREIKNLVEVRDIASLDLNADLVVLSSCHSARGRDVLGEGIVGLPWAFLSAGASGVVTSLWEVDDEGTKELMRLFYGNMILRGMPSGLALRQAQIDMWKGRRWKAPRFWAGFISQGDSTVRPFSLNKISSDVSSRGGDPRSRAMTRTSPPRTPF
jgi:CHAT domain-containing protein